MLTDGRAVAIPEMARPGQDVTDLRPRASTRHRLRSVRYTRPAAAERRARSTAIARGRGGNDGPVRPLPALETSSHRSGGIRTQAESIQVQGSAALGPSICPGD